jgi:3-oxoacyl-[acyl-carrier-protein] synthase-3
MKFHNVAIWSLECVDAPHRVPTAELSARLAPRLKAFGMPQNLLELLTGIHARRFWDPGTQPSTVAAMAGRKALAAAGIDPAEVGLLVSTSVSKDYVEPAVAALVHEQLALPETTPGFDVGNACLAFLTAMDLVSAQIERGEIEVGLIVDGEASRDITEATLNRLASPDSTPESLKQELASLTLGSGAVAMVLGRADARPGCPTYRGSVSLSASRHSGLCRGQATQMITDSGALLHAGIELAQRTFARAVAQLGWAPDLLDEVVIHQVSKTHTVQLCRALGLAPERMYAIFPELGNVGPASVPITLCKARELGRLKPGARVGLLGIGSGLNCTMAEVRW